MKINKIKKEIKGVFKPPKATYYLGKIVYGTPYMNPLYFNSSIISFRKLIKRTPEEIENFCKNSEWLRNKLNTKYKNLPIIRRTKYWIIKLFDNIYYIELGFPIMYHINELGYKWKYDTIRYEWEMK